MIVLLNFEQLFDNQIFKLRSVKVTIKWPEEDHVKETSSFSKEKDWKVSQWSSPVE